MRFYDPTEPLIYLRIPHCAGRSMVFLLARWFHEGYRQLDSDETAGIVSRIATRDSEGNWLPDVRCLQASFDHGRGFGLPYYYPEIKQYITILRDPFDAAISRYFAAKKLSREGHASFRDTPRKFSEHFPDVSSYLRQYPCWYFDHLPIGIDLSNYRRRLTEQFVYIGILEDLNGSVKSLAKLLGKPPFEIPRLNVSSFDEQVPEPLRVRFYQDYPLLKRIHEFALERYQCH
jgi:hypothetical protein